MRRRPSPKKTSKSDLNDLPARMAALRARIPPGPKPQSIRFNAVRAGKSKPKTPKPRRDPGRPIPWLFRRGGCERALICLAVNGPLTVRELGRATKIDSHKMWDIVERLVTSGLVVKRDTPGGRKYVALNRRLPIYRPLYRLLLALDKYWPATRDSQQIARWRMPFDKAVTTERLDHIFQSPVRSRILIFVAAVGECSQKVIYDTLGLEATSAWYALTHWEKQGVLRSRRFKTHRLYSLNPDFIVADELKALLRQIVVQSLEYQGLRAAVRPKMRALLKAAGP